MKNFLFKNALLLFACTALILSSCSDDDDTVSYEKLILGKWRCEVANGNWDELNFSSTTELTWTFYDASSGVTEKDEYTYVIDENTVFLTNKEDQSKSAHGYYLRNSEELTFQYFNGNDYFYYKE